MKHILAATLLALFCAPLAYGQFSGEFGDRRLKLLEDPLSVRFMGDADKFTKAKLQQAIDIAALAKDWKVLNQGDGRFELQTLKNGQHVLHVMVIYGDAFCEIRYIDSVDMMYKEIQDKGRNLRVIHGNYNVWIRELADTIGKRVGQPVTVSAPAAPPPVQSANAGGGNFTGGNGNFYSGGGPTRSGNGYNFNNRPGRGGRGPGGAGAGAGVGAVKLAHSRVVPQPSGFAAIDDVDKVPVREAGKDRYRTFLAAPAPKAFAVGEDGSFAMSVRDPDAMALALDDCAQRKVACSLYAVDDRVVFAADPQKRISQLGQIPRTAP
jgi:hypothetical protein